MKWYGIDEDVYNALVDLITEAFDAAQRMGDQQSETYYSYLLGELEECKVIAKGKRMNSEEEQRMLKLQRYLRMLHEGLKDPTDKDKNKRRKIAREAIEPTKSKPKKKHVPTYMSLKEIEQYLKDDPSLSNYERYELYCDEYDRVKKEKYENEAQSLDDICKELGIKRNPGRNK